MNAILIVGKMFTKKINIFVANDDEILTQKSSTLDTLNEDAFALAQEYNCSIINIKGAKPFFKKVQEKMKEEQLARYNEEKIKINLI